MRGFIGIENKNLENKPWWLERFENGKKMFSLFLKAVRKAALGLMGDWESISSRVTVELMVKSY